MRDNLKEARILIVDDEISVRDILSRKLAKEGYSCTVASDGTAALKNLSVYQFELVLLDINMPGKSGTSVLKQIVAKYEDTAVIMITALSDVKTAIETMRMGAYDYIIKPIDLSTIIVSIEKALDRRSLIVENKDYQLHLEEKVKKQTEKIRDTFLNSVESLVYALEAKDNYTSGHSYRVTTMAVAIAKEMGMSKGQIEKIRLAGLIHDIGKIGVRESILNKPGKLTDEEYQHVKSHAEIGERIISPIVEDKEILDIVRHHHERYDGKGYPDGLSAEEVHQEARITSLSNIHANILDTRIVKAKLSQGARILAVADAYDAMTSERPYRATMSPEEAYTELERCKEKQFDPDVVDALFRTIRRSDERESHKDDVVILTDGIS